MMMMILKYYLSVTMYFFTSVNEAHSRVWWLITEAAKWHIFMSQSENLTFWSVKEEGEQHEKKHTALEVRIILGIWAVQ